MVRLYYKHEGCFGRGYRVQKGGRIRNCDSCRGSGELFVDCASREVAMGFVAKEEKRQSTKAGRPCGLQYRIESAVPATAPGR